MRKYTEEELITIIDERLENWIFADGNHACDRHMNIDIKELKDRVNNGGSKYSSTFIDNNGGDDIIRELRYRLVRNITNIMHWVNDSNNESLCLKSYLPYNVKGFTYSLPDPSKTDDIYEVKNYIIVLSKKYANPFYMVTAYPMDYFYQFNYKCVNIPKSQEQSVGTYSRHTTKGHCTLCARY